MTLTVWADGEGCRPADGATRYAYRVVRVHPHDRKSFTQGLAYRDGSLYEGTGLYGHSSVRRVCVESGEVLQQRMLPADVFGEDIAVFGDSVIQLTWRSGRGFEYAAETLELRHTFPYTHEGWGITASDSHLIVSDGTAMLRLWDPTTFAEVSRVHVVNGGVPVERLNALAYWNGTVFANVWRTSLIAHIALASGQVLGWIDIGGLYRPPSGLSEIAVPNGITYDPESHQLLVTGKLWPHLFTLAVVIPA